MATFTYRRDVNRPLTYDEFDDNLLHVEELRDDAASSAQSASTSSSSSQQSAQSAAASEQSAQQSAQSAAQSYDDFDDRYLGPKSSDPATDNDGDPLQEGAMYWNTSLKRPFLYDGSSWVLAVLDANGALVADNNLSDLDNTSTARTNLGLGSSATRNVPSSGDASSTQVVTGGDSRLSDARTPTAHSHPWEDVNGKPDTATRWPSFSEVASKPATYPPSAHDHNIGDVSGLQSALDAKRAQDDTAFPRYDLASATTTATLDLSSQQVFRVDATSNRTLAFSNAPGSNRAMTVVVRLTGSSGTITWPAGIEWAEGTAPELRAVWTTVTLLWDGATWRGFVSGGAD